MNVKVRDCDVDGEVGEYAIREEASRVKKRSEIDNSITVNPKIELLIFKTCGLGREEVDD